MTLEEMLARKRELGYSNETLSKLSGVPLGTVQKVMAGLTRSPRQKTLEALAQALGGKEEQKSPKNRPSEPSAVLYESSQKMSMLQETPAVYAAQNKIYTIEDIYALPDGVRAELIDGKLYYMATPTRTHQRLTGEMHLTVANHIKAHGGSCEVYIPPFAVYLFGDESTYLEPDLTVVCDLSKLDERGCWGAPDWVVEVLSPSSVRKDMGIKLRKYRKAGVREYWMIHAEKRVVVVYVFDRKGDDNADDYAAIYSFDDEIPCSTFPELIIKPALML